MRAASIVVGETKECMGERGKAEGEVLWTRFYVVVAHSLVGRREDWSRGTARYGSARGQWGGTARSAKRLTARKGRTEETPNERTGRGQEPGHKQGRS